MLELLKCELLESFKYNCKAIPIELFSSSLKSRQSALPSLRLLLFWVRISDKNFDDKTSFLLLTQELVQTHCIGLPNQRYLKFFIIKVRQP